MSIRNTYISTIRDAYRYTPHTLVRQHRIVLRRDIVSQVVVQNQTQQTIEQREIDLLVHLRENRLHEHVALALARLPDVGQVVDALAPLVHEQRRWLGVLDEYRQPLVGQSEFE